MIEDADENGIKIIDKFNPIIVFDKDNQIGKEGMWQEFLNQYARLDYDGADEENEKSFFDIYLSYLTQSDDYIKFLLDASAEEKPTIPKWNKKAIDDRYNASFEKWEELKALINSLPLLPYKNLRRNL